jgi:hypothetical protein
VNTYFAKIGSGSGGGTGSGSVTTVGNSSTVNASTVNASNLNVSTSAVFQCPITTAYNPYTIGPGQIGHVVTASMLISTPNYNSYPISSNRNVSVATLSLYSGVWNVTTLIATASSNYTNNSLIVGFVRNTSTPPSINSFDGTGINSYNIQVTGSFNTNIFLPEVIVENTPMLYYFMMNGNNSVILARDFGILDVKIKAVRIA